METDAELVQRWRAGDDVAFDLIYERYKNMAMRTAYLLCKNQVDSEDIVQETFIQCYLHIGELRETAKFKSWMLQILVRSGWKAVKKGKRELASEEVEIQSAKRASVYDAKADFEPLRHTLMQERSQTLIDAINQLAEKHRIIVVLYYYDELSVKEIAKVVGCLEGTVKSRLYFARRQLEKQLKEADI